MVAVPGLDEGVAAVLDRPRRAGSEFVRALAREREGRIGLAMFVVLLVVIVVGPWIAPYGPLSIGVGAPLHGPSAQHLLGTDDFGRDILSRVLAGGRGVITVPFVATSIAFVVGATIGIVAAFRSGLFDTVVTRLLDMSLALPPLLVVLIIISGLGGSSFVQAISIAIVFIPRIARVTRGAAQSVASNEYVEIARARGEGALSISLREILPNITGMLTVEFAVRFTYAILFVATLNFLGVGAQPPSPNWGLMVSNGLEIMGIVPFAAIAPAAGIALLSISLNMIADAGARVLARDVDSSADVFKR
jgi:peptide/nickel transport system permease protein